MPTFFDETPPYEPGKYDVILGNYGYRVLNMTLDSAPAVAPRFNTGQQGENDLDMLRIEGNDTFQGGMFQTEAEDFDMVQTIINGYVHPDNMRLYPTPKPTHLTVPAEFPNDQVMCSAIFKDNLYMAVKDNTKNSLWRVSQDGVVTNIPLPAKLEDYDQITSMHWPRGTDLDVLMILSGNTARNGGNIFHYDGATVTEATGHATFAGSLRNNVYVWTDPAIMFIWDEDDSKWIKVTVVGPTDIETNLPNAMMEFNYRIWCGMPTGLYSFDGVTSAKFVEAESQREDNCKFFAEMHGWMYFNMDGYIWRTNSVTVERLHDFRDTIITGMTAGNDRVYIMTQGGPGNSIIEREGWAHTDPNLWVYDGVGWFLYNNQQEGATEGEDDATWIAAFNSKIYTHFDGTVGSISVIDVANEWQPGPKEICTVISSVIDNNYPNVSKYLESIEVDYEDLDDQDFVRVQYRKRTDIGTWSEWLDSDKDIEVDNPNPKRFFVSDYKLMQYQLIFGKDVNSSSSIESAKLHFAVQPETRKRWRIAFVCSGVDKFGSTMLKDRTEDSRTAKELRDNLYAHERQITPSMFLTPDYCTLDQTIDDNYIGDIQVKGKTYTMRDRGTVFIEGELMNYDSKTPDSLHVTKRGAWDTVQAEHTAGVRVTEFHRVFLESIINERFELNEAEENTYVKDQEYGIESVITAQITEVNVEHEY